MASQTDSPCRVLVMASGFGSNFQALIDAVAAGRIPNSKIIRLITNRRNVHSITRAKDAGMRHLWLRMSGPGRTDACRHSP